jgi:hypothetical protein
MTVETVQHGDSWWRQGDDGTWYRWNEQTRSWEYADPTWEHADPTPDTATTPPSARGDYRSPRGVGRALARLLGMAVVLDIAAAAGFYAKFRRLDAARGGAGPMEPAARAAGELEELVAVALIAVLLAIAPVFIVWFHRLYTNLPALGAAELRFGRGWAIGAWFVPLLNLWRPKQIANDIWRASDPQSDAGTGPQWQQRPVAGVVHLWWALYLLSNLVNQAVVRFTLTANTAAELRTQAVAEMGAATLDAIAAGVAMWFVTVLTVRHEQRAALVGSV